MGEAHHTFGGMARRRLVAVLIMLGLLLGALELVSATVASAGSVPTSAEADMLGRVNADRRAAGLSTLADDGAAASLARRWSQTMGDSGSLRHNPNLANDVSREVTNQWTRIGENVGNGNDAASVYAAFMGSSAHRGNILGDYNRIGLGAYRDNGGRLWVTMVFVKGPAVARAASPEFASFGEAVQRQYLDFLGRSGDVGGLGFWHSSLSNGAVDEAQMVKNFLDSPEFGATAKPVVRLYLAYFNRIPDYGGLTHWIGAHRGGMPLIKVSDAFADSAEFKSKYGSLNDDQFVDQVYKNVLGRTADAEGRSYWVGQLRSGKVTRGGVMVNFSESAEYKKATSANVDVIVTYVGMLQRSPDPSGYAYWVDQARQGGLTRLIAGFLGSPEYGKRTSTGTN